MRVRGGIASTGMIIYLVFFELPMDDLKLNESKDRRSALRISLIYMVVGIVWIFLSDRLLVAMFHNLQTVTDLSILKGCFYVLATGWMLYALIFRDLGSIRRSDRAKIESQENYRRIVETAQEGIWILNEQLETTYVNHRIVDMLGYDPSEILGRSVLDFAFPEEAEGLRERIQRRQAGQSEEYDNRYRKKDGSELWAIVSATAFIDPRDGSHNSFAMLTDITDRIHQAERKRELEERQNEFYRKTILAATEGKLLITSAEQIYSIVGQPLAQWKIAHGEDIGRIRGEVREIAASYGMNDTRKSEFILCIGEATTNACKHADGAEASLHRIQESLVFLVADHGPGIETITLPEVALARRYTTAKSLGMGYKAMISLADRIYLATGPAGTTVAIEMAIIEVEKPIILPDIW